MLEKLGKCARIDGDPAFIMLIGVVSLTFAIFLWLGGVKTTKILLKLAKRAHYQSFDLKEA